MNKELIAKCLSIIALENHLVMDGKAWVSPNGVRYVQTMTGYIPAEVEYSARLRAELDDLLLQNAHLKTVINNHLRYERVLDKKAYIKIVRILESRVSDSEKIAQIRKYLKL